MKKLLLVFAASVFVAATNVNAQSVKAYRGSTATDYAINELEYGTINNADSIVVTGTLNTEQAYKLRESLKGSFISASFQLIGDFNDQLIKADFSNAEFTTNNLDSMFFYFHNLTQVIFPNKENSIAISMKDIFNNCSLLKSIENLDKFSNITNLAYAFYQCNGLTSVTFSSVPNNNSIDFSYAFYQGTSLVGVYNLDKFNNISDLKAMFYNCNKLDSIAFSSTVNNNAIDAAGCFSACESLRKIVNFEKFTNVTDITGTFSSCDKLGIIRLGNVPAKYDNAFPRTYVIFLPDGVTDYPDNYSWHSAVMFPITSVTASGVASYVEGGAMALPAVTFKPENDYLSSSYFTYKYEISNNSFSTFEEYVPNTTVTKDYTGYKMRVGVKNARMDDYKYSSPVDIKKYEINVFAYFNGNQKKYAKEQLTSGMLNKADSITLTGKWNNDELSKFRQALWVTSSRAENDYTQKVDMSQITLDGDISLWNTFCNYSKLEKVILPNAVCSNKIDMSSTFEDCANLKEVSNFENFTNVGYAEEAFYNCSSLKEIHIGTDVNSTSNFSGSNIFTGCNALKYLPSGTTSIPSGWQTSYNNFILPITSVSLTGTASFSISEAFVLPTVNHTPTYYAATDIVYELSNNNFTTKETYTPNTIVTKDYSGYKMRIGVKNASMNGYVYSSSIDVTKIVYVLTAYTNGVANKYSIEQLATGTLANADSVVLHGALSDDNMLVLQKSLKTSWQSGTGDDDSTNPYNTTTNNNLKAFDMSNATFSEDISNGMYAFFRNCTALKRVDFPKKSFSEKVTLRWAFMGCTSLETINNLDKIQNYLSINRTFKDCKNLKSVSFSEGNSIRESTSYSFSWTFYNCEKLEEILNFETFTKCQFCQWTFMNCSSLKEIHLGFDPNPLYAEHDYETKDAFTNCNAIKYLPSDVTTVPDNWKNYKNFVLPITSVTQSGYATILETGGIMELPTLTIQPAYCAATDVVYQLSNNNFSTYTTHSAADVLTGNYDGYQIRVGAKNERMNSYVYSTNSAQVSKAPLAKAYANGVSTEYGISELATGTLATADSVVLSGVWNDTQIAAFRMSLKSNGEPSTTNSTLKKADLSDVTLSGNITSGMEYLFRNCQNLVSVALPSTETAGTVSLNSAFEGCTSLESIANLDKLTNITSLYEAFYYCPKLESLTFASTENSNSVNMRDAFYNCNALKNIDVSSFANITNLERSFESCDNLESVKFSDKANGNSIDFYETFYECPKLAAIENLDKFTNLYDFRETFSGCQSLNTIKLGTDPNTENAKKLSGWYSPTEDFFNHPFYQTFDNCNALVYLPESVTTVPDNWQGYTNFVLPFTAIEPSGIATFDAKTGKLSLPAISYTPSYCAGTDFTYQLSNNNFSTYTTHSAADVLTGNYVGYQIRVGAKNERMSNYVYSTNSAQIGKAPLAKAYANGVSTEYGISELATGTLATADSVVLSGVWNDTQIAAFRMSLKSDGEPSTTNSTLKKADLSDVTLSGNITSGMEYLFRNCQNLVSVALPSTETAGKVSLHNAFYNCSSLESIANLDKLTNIIDMYMAFQYCSNLESLTFASTENSNSVNMRDAFYNCNALKNIDVSSFTNISDLENSFENCHSLVSVKFSEKTNSNGVPLLNAFYNCPKLTTIENLEKFTNLYDFRYAFEYCKSLVEVELGTDPNSESANKLDSYWSSSSTPYDNTFDGCNALVYLPEGVTTVPDNWKNYNNFVLPITSVTQSGYATILETGGIMELPTFTIQPAYCAATDVVYQLSNNNFITSKTYSANEVLNGNYVGYNLRIGVKNPSMTDYVYSTSASEVKKGYLLIAYNGEDSTIFDSNSLTAGSLTGYDRIVMSSIWDNTNLQKLQKALKNGDSNTTLATVDASEAKFANNSKFDHLFENCTSLIEIKLPSANTGSISLTSAFAGCTSLKFVINLDKLSGICSLDSAFAQCSSLSTLTFCSTTNTNSIDATAAFAGCSKLSYANNFKAFANITSLKATFKDCSNLSNSITLGVDPNKLDAQKLVGTFDGTSQYCNKYLPNGVETIPAVWENAGYTRFVVPIKSVTAQISAFTDEDGTASVSVDSYTVEPAYAYYYTNTIYSNDDFATTVSSSDLLPGFKVKVGVSNNAMSNYVYSDPVTATTITSSITAYRGKAKSIYKTSELQTGLLADADSIILSGTWHNNNLSKLKNAIKESTYSTNSSLKKFDMSGAKFLGVISSINAMFYSCSSLEKVILPPTEFTSKISLYEIFEGCSKLTEIVNLDKLSNITSLNYAFHDCYLLQNVKFSDKTNNNEISLYYAFCDCNAMKNIDVSSFANIYDLERSFESCDSLVSVKFSEKTNSNGVHLLYAFYNCPKLTTIENLEKFTNLYDFRYAFEYCKSLAEVELGTDPNSESANKLDYSYWSSGDTPYDNTFDGCNALVYLPEGVTTVPDNWKNYKNFVLPITSAKATGPAVIDGNSKKVTLPSFTCEPSFAVVQDTIYQISNDNFKTSKTLNANDLLNGNITDYKVRIGIKNNSMDDFIFSDTVGTSSMGYVMAFTNGKMAKYSAADLTTGLLANADSVILADVWNDTQIAAFRMSLKSNGEPSTTNSTLKKADLSDVTLSGDIIMKELFDYCKALVSVAMPSTETAGTVSLNSAFEECTSLESVANLDKFINLTSLFETFNNCPKLKSVTLAATTNSNEVSMEKTFYNCSSLDSIANLEKLTNVVNLRYTFSNCEKLKVIHIGGIKSSNFADKYYTPYTFDNCNAIKYLPEDITTIPDNWMSYTNFVLPIDSVRISGSMYILKTTNKLKLPDATYYQPYVAATDVKWQFSNDNFATAIECNENANIDFTKYSIRCAAKNDAMSDYVYSNTLSGIKEVYAIVTAYTSTVQKTYSVTELTTGLLANADSIVMDGLWSDNDILALQKSLKTSWSGDVSDAYNMNETTNNKLKKANMSSIAFSEDINHGFVCLFRNCKELTRVIFPEKKFTQGLNLDYAFRNCTKLIAVDNLINADSLISLESIFIYCYDLDSVSFSPELKYKPYSLRYSFYYCYKLRCVDNFESFVNVSNLRSTFESCENLKEIHLGFDPNVLYEDYYENVQYTFYDCPALKYLPEGVTTIPESWEWYSNFVVPFSMYIDVNYSNKLLSLSTPAANPSYAAITDVVWKISSDNFSSYDTYSVTGKLDAARTNISSDYEIYSQPLSGDYGGYQLICEAYNPLYSAKTKFEIHYSGWIEEVGIKDTKCDIFALYPNPATTSFQINVGEQQVQMSIFNSIGNMVKTQTVFGLTQVDISDMPQGIYYVKVGSQAVKLVKQ